MRIVLFGAGGTIPLEAMRALAERHEIAAVVRPAGRAAWRQWLRLWKLRPWKMRARLHAADPFRDAVRAHGCLDVNVHSARDASLARMLRRVKPDLLCIATFPWLLPEEILGASRLGALNLHASLLPRHRGRNPWFWLYHSDDRETGVTVHYATSRADAGAILGQDRFPLPRGFPIERLYADSGERGANLLAQCVDALAEGVATATAQDEALATRAPSVKPGTRMIDFSAWPVERVWHFLAGLQSQYREPLQNSRGDLIRYKVAGFDDAEENAIGEKLGSLEDVDGGWRLQCVGGVVNLTRA